jgi:uncharacterized protein (DUF58 family)
MTRAAPLLRVGGPWAPAAADLAHAARVLQLRSRHEVAGALAGGYRSAFRGGGIEFEESRPYTPGDDVRAIDWNALARTGSPYVKHYREERDQTLLLLLDVSASMAFGSAGPAKGAFAARCAALLAAAAAYAGDRVALWSFDHALRCEIEPGRGEVHGLRVLRALIEAAAPGDGGTALAPLLARVRERVAKRAIVFLLSDLRDETLLAGSSEGRRLRSSLAAVARRHDLVAGFVVDPREQTLPPAGTLRVADPEAAERSWLLHSGSRRVRERYGVAAHVRQRLLERRLRAGGADWLVLRSDADPLRALGRFFAHRAVQRVRGRGTHR